MKRTLTDFTLQINLCPTKSCSALEISQHSSIQSQKARRCSVFSSPYQVTSNALRRQKFHVLLSILIATSQLVPLSLSVYSSLISLSVLSYPLNSPSACYKTKTPTPHSWNLPAGCNSDSSPSPPSHEAPACLSLPTNQARPYHSPKLL